MVSNFSPRVIYRDILITFWSVFCCFLTTQAVSDLCYKALQLFFTCIMRRISWAPLLMNFCMCGPSIVCRLICKEQRVAIISIFCFEKTRLLRNKWVKFKMESLKRDSQKSSNQSKVLFIICFEYMSIILKYISTIICYVLHTKDRSCVTFSTQWT